MCCTRLAGNTGRKKNRHFGTIARLCRAISSKRRHVSTIGKNLLNSNTSTCPDNMVNFGLLTAEICWRVWGTPANGGLLGLILNSGIAQYEHVCKQKSDTLNTSRFEMQLGFSVPTLSWKLCDVLLGFCGCRECFHGNEQHEYSAAHWTCRAIYCQLSSVLLPFLPNISDYINVNSYNV